MANSKIITPSKGFTTAFLNNLRPKDKRVELADKGCSGLRLRLEPSGRKTFVWYYADAGRNRVKTLGRYGELTLAQARKDLQKAKEKHADGESVSTPTDAPKTVKELAEQFYKRRIIPHRKHPDAVRSMLDTDIIPKLGKKKLTTLSTPVVAGMIHSVVDRGAVCHAGKVLAVTKQMFSFAEGIGLIDRNPAYSLDKKNLGCVDNVRERYLLAEEIAPFWHALDRYERLSEQVRIGLKILLLTGVRSGELLKARWEHIDFDKAEWFIPEENSKTTAWTVPVVPMVRALLHDLKEIADDLHSSWVMAGLTDGPISDKALGRAMRRLFQLNPDLAPCVPHDMRRTLRTHLEDLGIEPHIAEKCLNHSLGRIERTYNKNTLIEKRRAALEKWADYVYSLVTPADNVAVPQG
jgi:integrase